MNTHRTSRDVSLCYLPASKVTSPAGPLSDLTVLSATGEPLGSIVGVVIDAAAGRVLYLHVQLGSAWQEQQVLLFADHLAHVESRLGVLRLRSDAVLATSRAAHLFDATALPGFA